MAANEPTQKMYTLPRTAQERLIARYAYRRVLGEGERGLTPLDGPTPYDEEPSLPVAAEQREPVGPSAVSQEEGMRRLIRFAFSDDDGDPDLSLLPGFKAALAKATRAAQAIADAEQRGAERERAEVRAFLGNCGAAFRDVSTQFAVCAAIKAGKHIKPPAPEQTKETP